MYDTTPGKLPALLDRFEKVNVPFFAKQGIGMFGFWTDDIGVSNRLTYIVTFDSMGDRERKWDAFQADPEWQKLRQEERQRDGEWVIGLRNTLMRLTPYSPEPRITTNIQELRVYDAMPAKLPAVNDRFANHTGRFFKKHGIEEIGYWTDVIGTGNQLWYMLGYDDLPIYQSSDSGSRSSSATRHSISTMSSGKVSSASALKAQATSCP